MAFGLYKILFAALVVSTSILPAFCEPFKDWQALILRGRNAEEAGDYSSSIKAFSDAVVFSESGTLPPKCLPISLCRQIRSELLSGMISASEPLFSRLISLAESQKRQKTFDPEVGVWMADVADTYMSKKVIAPLELRIKHSNRLKMLAIDISKKEYFDSLMTLASFYVENGQIDDGVRIIVQVEASKEKRTGKNDLPNTLFQEAIHCKVLQKLEPAKKMALLAVGKAKSGSKSLSPDSISTYYCFIGMCALASHEDRDAQQWLTKAIKEGKSIAASPGKPHVKSQLSSLVSTVKADEMQNKMTLAESEYKLLLAAQKAIFPNDIPQHYATLSLLTNNLAKSRNCPEFERYMRQSIAIAKSPRSYAEKDLPDLYMRLGMVLAAEHKMDDASDSFSKSLELDSSHDQYQSSLKYLWWGYFLNENKRYSLAESKLTKAIKTATGLPAHQRGTVAADALQLLALLQVRSGNRSAAETSLKDSTAEIQLQKQLHSKLGPDIYHRMGS